MGYNDAEIVAGTIIVLLSTISLIASLTTMKIIYDLKRWNGYMLLVFYLSACEAVYDGAAYFLLGFRADVSFSMYKELAVSSGLAVSLWTNVMSFILLYTVCTLQSVNIEGGIRKVAIAIAFVSLSLATVLVILYQEDKDNEVMNYVYYWFRIGSIGLNVLIYFVLFLLLSDLGLMDLLDIVTGNDRTVRGETKHLLSQLTRRLVYYPIVQILTRAGASWWEYQYGFQSDSFDSSGAFSPQKQLSVYLFAISNSTAGIGYFLVFIKVQPLAYGRLTALINTLCRRSAGEEENSVNDLQSDVVVSAMHTSDDAPSLPPFGVSPLGSVISSDSGGREYLQSIASMDENRLWREIDRRKESRDNRMASLSTASPMPNVV